jgi:hypothetical protein
LCIDTRVNEIPEVAVWILKYQIKTDHAAFYHNPFTGKHYIRGDKKSYLQMKIDVLIEMRKRISEDKRLTMKRKMEEIS